MSIIIRDMKMPKGCTDCPFAERIPPGRTRCLLTCRLLSEGYKAPPTERNGHCPLVELPEKHGRLIDERVAYDKIAEQEGGYYMDMDGVDCGLGETPTVIEAEGDDE